MPDPLEALLRSIGEIMAKLCGHVIDCFTYFANHFWLTVLFTMAGAVLMLNHITSLINQCFGYIVYALDLAYGQSDLSIQVTDWWRMGNAILPLSEALALFNVYVVVCAACTAYRFVKSHIPFL